MKNNNFNINYKEIFFIPFSYPVFPFKYLKENKFLIIQKFSFKNKLLVFTEE